MALRLTVEYQILEDDINLNAAIFGRYRMLRGQSDSINFVMQFRYVLGAIKLCTIYN